MNYIACAEDESEESTELPLEPDGTLAMSTLQAQYPGASGLKFRYVFSFKRCYEKTGVSK